MSSFTEFYVSGFIVVLLLVSVLLNEYVIKEKGEPLSLSEILSLFSWGLLCAYYVYNFYKVNRK